MPLPHTKSLLLKKQFVQLSMVYVLPFEQETGYGRKS